MNQIIIKFVRKKKQQIAKKTQKNREKKNEKKIAKKTHKLLFFLNEESSPINLPIGYFFLYILFCLGGLIKLYGRMFLF